MVDRALLTNMDPYKINKAQTIIKSLERTLRYVLQVKVCPMIHSFSSYHECSSLSLYPPQEI